MTVHEIFFYSSERSGFDQVLGELITQAPDQLTAQTVYKSSGTVFEVLVVFNSDTNPVVYFLILQLD